jgi:RNA polymerase sigma factor (sigma-70 family)
MAAEMAEVQLLVQRPFDAEGAGRESRAALVALLFERHSRALLWYVQRLTPTREDAEDVVQEAFTRLLDAPALEPDTGRARAYLFRTAVNAARDRRRRGSARCEERHVSLESLELAGCEPDPAAVVDFEQGIDIMAAALTALPLRPRNAFLLHVEEDMTYRQIADELGVSKKTIERDVAMTTEFCRVRVSRWKAAG